MSEVTTVTRKSCWNLNINISKYASFSQIDAYIY